MKFGFGKKKKKGKKDEKEASHFTIKKEAVVKEPAKKAPKPKLREVVEVKKEKPKKAAPKKIEVKKEAKVEPKKKTEEPKKDIKVDGYRELVDKEHADKAAAAELRRRRHLGYN